MRFEKMSGNYERFFRKYDGEQIKVTRNRRRKWPNQQLVTLWSRLMQVVFFSVVTMGIVIAIVTIHK